MIENPFRLDGRVAVVTGAGKGIGRAIAMCLAQAGAKVAVASRTQSDLDSLAQEIKATGGEALAVQTDVTQRESLEKLIGVPLRRLGTPEDIGYATVFLASEASAWITDQCLYVTGGL